MCLPALIPLALVAVTAASAGLAYMGQQQQASAQNQMAQNNAQNANDSYRLQQQSLQAKFQQQQDQVTQEDANQSIIAARLQGEINVSAAEAGVSGVSLDAIQSQVDRERGNTRAVSEKNLAIAQLDTLHSERNAYYQALDRRNSVPFGQYPSLLTPILQTAGAGLGVYGSYFYKPTATLPAVTSGSAVPKANIQGGWSNTSSNNYA